MLCKKPPPHQTNSIKDYILITSKTFYRIDVCGVSA